MRGKDKPNELIKQGEVEKEELSAGLMKKPFNPSLINITTKPLTVDLLIKRMQAEPPEIDLTPAFQRKNDLWSKKEQSQLIESLLIQFPLPAFYFDATDDNKWLVVDGLQRLCAINNFAIQKNLKLEGLEFLNHHNGKGIDDFDRSLRRRIEEAQVTVYTINTGTPSEVKYNLFKRLNTNGLVLNSQEIRHALNHGIPAEFIGKLAASKEFKRAVGNIPTERMLDREFVTRFIAFYISPISEYKPDLDVYMNEKMKQIKNFTETERKNIKHHFTASMKLAFEIFGKHAFRKIFNQSEPKKPLNKALFEVWSVTLSKLSDKQRDILSKNKDLVLNNFIHLMNSDTDFVSSISSSTDHKKKIEYRYSKIEALINEVLNIEVLKK